MGFGMSEIKKRKKPTFQRTNYGRTSRSRIKKGWRRPRGIDNKQLKKLRYMGKLPSIGYRNAATVRGMHPSGKHEVLIESPSQIEGLSNAHVRIASGVGGKKRAAIIKRARELALRVLNE
jgi:large subunit ribosomal protein L32e